MDDASTDPATRAADVPASADAASAAAARPVAQSEPYEEGTAVLLLDESARATDREEETSALGMKGEAQTAVSDKAATETTTTTTTTFATATTTDPHITGTGTGNTTATTSSDGVSTPAAGGGSVEGFVQPSSYLRRPRAVSKTMASTVPREETPTERDQKSALRSIRVFLKRRTSYDVLPLSYRLIMFDTSLLVKKSLNILVQNGIVSAPLWDSKTSTFAGMLTTSDYINLIQYYWQNPDAVSKIDQFRLDSLRDIEKAIDVAPIETVSVHPMRSLYEACRRLLEARARRIPMIDIDDDTQRAMVVSVLTQYRLLKFVAINVTETQLLRIPLKYLPNVGTYSRLMTADMDTPVIKVIHMLVSKQISSVPILNSDGVVVNVFEAVDVITLIKGGNYDCLTLPVGEALSQRPPDFPGIFTCSLEDRLDSIFDTIRKSRVHRFIVIDDSNRLKGLLTLSDILKYILLEGEDEDQT